MYIQAVNGNKYIVNLDWVAFNVRMLSEPDLDKISKSGYRAELLPGNNVFKDRILIRDNLGDKILTCLFHPYSSVIHPLLMTVQINNKYLYCDRPLTYPLELLQSLFWVEINRFSRIDFCCDFVPDKRQRSLIKKLRRGDCYLQGKHEGGIWWKDKKHKSDGSRIKKLKLSEKQLQWGSPISSIKIKIYDKSRELGLVLERGQKLSDVVIDTKISECEKPYIAYQWKDFGFTDVTNVWRLEFSVSDCGQLRFEDKVISVDNVNNADWVVGVFKSLYDNRFVVRKNEGRQTGKHNRDTIMPFLVLDGLVTNKLKVAEPNEIKIATHESVVLLRRLMADFESPVVMQNPVIMEQLGLTIDKVIETNNLQQYFYLKMGMPFQEYFESYYEKSGVGLFDTIPSLNNTWQ